MIKDTINELYEALRLVTYRQLFGRIREREGSLSATEVFAADMIYLLGSPTVTQLADALGVSQPNATYKITNLVAKGYVKKTPSEDRRESRVTADERFHMYYDAATQFLTGAGEKLSEEYSREELELFERMLRSLNSYIAE